MYRMLQLDEADDFVIATGKPRRLEEFIDLAFAAVGLDWRKHVEIDQDLFRPSDIIVGFGDASKANTVFGWKAKSTLEDIVAMMIAAEQQALHN